MKSSSIDLSYLIENSFNDALFIKDILQTTKEEFLGVLDALSEVQNETNYSSHQMYSMLHKYKPTAAMYALDSYPIFEEYGSGKNMMSYETFIKIKEPLFQNISAAIGDIEEELKKY